MTPFSNIKPIRKHGSLSSCGLLLVYLYREEISTDIKDLQTLLNIYSIEYEMDYEEMPGTYVFEDFDYEGEDEKSGEEDEMEDAKTTNEIIDKKKHSAGDDSQEIPFNPETKKKCVTSIQLLDSFQSFGTPVSSINNTQVSSSEINKNKAYEKVGNRVSFPNFYAPYHDNSF